MIYSKILKYITLLLLSFNLFAYSAKVIFIDNNFKNLKDNKINKVIYLSSKISFDIKKGKIFNLYRNIDSTLNKKTNNYTDLNKEAIKKEKEFKKVCVIQVKVVSVVNNLIKVVEFNKCKNRKNENMQVLGEFQLSKIGDFINIETIFDENSKETINENKFSDIIAAIFMIGIDDDFNYLLESGIKDKVSKSSDQKEGGDKQIAYPITKGDKNKKLPRKKKKRKKKKASKGVTDFEKIRL